VIMDYNGIFVFVTDDFKLRTHVTNNWELRVNWNASRYQSLAPSDGWNYTVSLTDTPCSIL